MSSADPLPPPTQGSDPPPTPRYPRPRRIVYAAALTFPLVLLLAVGALIGVAWAVPRLVSAVQLTPEPAADPSETDEGQRGVGDPYFPDYGSSGYDALSYQVSLSWDPDQQRLTSTAVVSARAAQALTSFYLDLALQTDRVLVNGAPAEFEHTGFQDLRVTPAQPIAAGADFSVTVNYTGAPGTIKRGDITPWYHTGQEWTIVGEPESSAWWFPANDHPSDPALLDVSVRVPAGMEAVSVGRLVSSDAGNEPDFDTWHWVTGQPLASYVAFLSIGQFELQQGAAAGRPYVYAVSEQLPAADRKKAFAALQTSGDTVARLESTFGPYPFTELGGIVPAHNLQFDGLESQTRPVYDREAILSQGSSELIVHELAHMWYGNNVTLTRWDDIFLNEAYASWAQWSDTERSGGRSAIDRLNATYDRARGRADFWRITMIDPGKDHLFDTVYFRGPMALQALHNVLGDAAFAALARDWGGERGPKSLEQWMVEAQSRTSVDLVPFFDAWIYRPTAPDRTEANGFRS